MAAYELTRELETAKRLAHIAGERIRPYHGDVDVDRKAGNEPVTRADRESSDLILAGLHAAFPEDVVISEEEPDNLRRLEPGLRVWFVDPLDGTRDFVRGDDGFSVMIGLMIEGRPRLGAVYQVTRDRMFAAAAGSGAHVETVDGSRPLRCSEVARLADVRLVASKSHRDGILSRVKEALGLDNEFNIGSVGLKMGLISLAERDLYVNPSGKCKLWDTCAPEAILVEAGGEVTDLYGQPLVYDTKELFVPHGIVASNGHVHAEVIERLGPLFND